MLEQFVENSSIFESSSIISSLIISSSNGKYFLFVFEKVSNGFIQIFGWFFWFEFGSKKSSGNKFFNWGFLY